MSNVYMRNFINSDWNFKGLSTRYGDGSVVEVDSDYSKSVNELSEYMLSVTGRNLPGFAVTPAHFIEYQQKLAEAKTTATYFQTSMLVNLHTLPNTMKGQTLNITNTFEAIISEADILIQNPQNENAKNILKTFIDTVTTPVSAIVDTVESIESELDDFEEKITKQAETLKEISDLMLTDKGVDEDEYRRVGDLNSTISVLRAQSDDYKKLGEKSAEMKQYLKNIKDMWGVLAEDIQLVKSDLDVRPLFGAA